MNNGQGKNLRSEKPKSCRGSLLFHCRTKEEEENDWRWQKPQPIQYLNPVTVSEGKQHIHSGPESGTPCAVTLETKYTTLYCHPVLFCIKQNQTVISRFKLNTRLRRHHHVFCSTQPLHLVLQTIFNNQFLRLPPAFASTETSLQVLHIRCHFKLIFYIQTSSSFLLTFSYFFPSLVLFYSSS